MRTRLPLLILLVTVIFQVCGAAILRASVTESPEDSPAPGNRPSAEALRVYNPPLNLPFRKTFPPAKLDSIIKEMRDAADVPEKMDIAGKAVMKGAKLLTPEQGLRLFETLGSPADLSEFKNRINGRLIGMSVRQASAFLNKLPEPERLKALPAFKDLIVDFQNKDALLGVFSDPALVLSAREILGSFAARSLLFGALTGRIAFVLDFSGSMLTPFEIGATQYTRVSYLKDELYTTTLSLINTPSFFNVIVFNQGTARWRQNLQFASANNVQSAQTWYSPAPPPAPTPTPAFGPPGPPPGGTTNAYDALEIAFEQTGVEMIVFLSDGMPNGPKNTAQNIINTSTSIWNPTKRVKINTIALMLGGDESGANKTAAKNFMQQLAEANDGSYTLLEF